MARCQLVYLAWYVHHTFGNLFFSGCRILCCIRREHRTSSSTGPGYWGGCAMGLGALSLSSSAQPMQSSGRLSEVMGRWPTTESLESPCTPASFGPWTARWPSQSITSLGSSMFSSGEALRAGTCFWLFMGSSPRPYLRPLTWSSWRPVLQACSTGSRPSWWSSPPCCLTSHTGHSRLGSSPCLTT